MAARSSSRRENGEDTPPFHCPMFRTKSSSKLKRIIFHKSFKAAAVAATACSTALFVIPESVSAHGFAGSRFFPATLSTDDPFINDELSLPTVSSIVTPDAGGTRDTEVAVDIAKRITPNFGIEVGETVINLKPFNESSHTGFGNLEL